MKLDKLPAWDPKQVREKSDVKAESDKSGIPVHFADLMALCFLKNAELAKHLQKYKGRVVLRGDNIKDKTGYQAVFTEQGASASQMVGAKSLDACARMPGMAGSAADAISAYTQVTWHGRKTFSSCQRRDAQLSGYVFPAIGGQKNCAA